MPTEQLCSETRVFGWMPWVLIGFYLLIGFVTFAVRTVFPSASRRPVRWWPLLLGASFAVGAMFFVRSKSNDAFAGFVATPSGLSLRYLWPKAALELPTSAIEGIAVVRGRHFSKSKRTADHAWLKVYSGGKPYFSCESSDLGNMVAAGHELERQVGKPIVWQERCPDPDNRAVPATESLVTAPGLMAVPAACSSR